MALKRRELLLGLPVAMGATWACAPRSRAPLAEARYQELLAPRAASAQRTILVCMPETTQTREVWTGLSDELAGEFALVAIRVDDRSAAPVIEEGLRRHRPAAIVLMNNPTVAAYADYQRRHPNTAFPPAVIVMTSFLERDSSQIVAATGISYEVPLITVVTNLRKLIAASVERVGVVVRAPLTGFVARQAALARREKISVASEVVSASPNASEVKRALRSLKHSVDAIWILNDDRLLSPRLITEAWLPSLNDRPFRPTIVGAGSLVSPEQSFGTFAVLPDHTALGAQAAALLLDLSGSGWALPEGAMIQGPLSTTTTVDLVQVRERFSLQQNALAQVDRILE